MGNDLNTFHTLCLTELLEALGRSGSGRQALCAIFFIHVAVWKEMTVYMYEAMTGLKF